MLGKSAEQTVEGKRIRSEFDAPVPPWKKWGAYVSERAWGTVREDYSADGDAWDYCTYENATEHTFRWGEDAIAGWCDRYQTLIFAPVFWNGKDPLLKERLFGLSSKEGNHGEDVKEYYYHLDATPTHSYMKYLYKYPQNEFPYAQLREESAKRSARDGEYELVDTGIFSDNRYFDIFIEHAKASEDDICIKIDIHNRSSEAAPLHLLMQLWFRNMWMWGDVLLPKPEIHLDGDSCLVADDGAAPILGNLSFEYKLGKRYLYGPSGAEALFTDNQHIPEHLMEAPKDFYTKNAFHRYLVGGEKEAVNPKQCGSKACLHYFFDSIPGHGVKTVYFRLSPKALHDPLKEVPEIIKERKKEADAFYAAIHPHNASEEEKRIQRQALAGILWNKQIYLFDVERWLKGDNSFAPPPDNRYHLRNIHWRHLNSMRVLLMPDKWEYPYFCAWDQAFHCLALGLVDIEDAKEQLWLLLFDQFQHPNGQIPACEWEFSDLNPPVQAWAALKLFQLEQDRYGREDREFLERCFHKLLMNFSWWVNKVDYEGNNVFEGGFLGLDNITVLDRSTKLTGGVKLQQSDGTGWMAMFCLNLMRIALILAHKDPVYESLATKFFEHYVYIAHAMKRRGDHDYELWSEKDGFFYDALTYPDGSFAKFRVRSLVGIIPLYAVEILEEKELKKFPEFHRDVLWFLQNRKDLVASCILSIEKGGETRYLLSMMHTHQLENVLIHVWNSEEFRSSFGLRSLSKFHEKNPFKFGDKSVGYEPSESLEKLKGGNSNWRGPIWAPTTFLLIDALKTMSLVLEDSFKISNHGGKAVPVEEIANYFSEGMIRLFLPDENGKRPFLGADFPFAKDPHWKDLLLFYEYFNPETGKGLGASHQSGWTSLVANIIDSQRQ